MSTTFRYATIHGNKTGEWLSTCVGDDDQLTVGDLRKALLGMDPEAHITWQAADGSTGHVRAAGASETRLLISIVVPIVVPVSMELLP